MGNDEIVEEAFVNVFVTRYMEVGGWVYRSEGLDRDVNWLWYIVSSLPKLFA